MEPLSASARGRAPGTAVQHLGAAPAGDRAGWRAYAAGAESLCHRVAGAEFLARIRELVRAFAEEKVEVVLDVGTEGCPPVVTVNSAHESSVNAAARRAASHHRLAPPQFRVYLRQLRRGKAISSPRRRPFRSQAIPEGPTTPCSSMAASAWARLTSCMPWPTSSRNAIRKSG